VDSCHSRQGPETSSCEHSIEHYFIKYSEFLDTRAAVNFSRGT